MAGLSAILGERDSRSLSIDRHGQNSSNIGRNEVIPPSEDRVRDLSLSEAPQRVRACSVVVLDDTAKAHNHTAPLTPPPSTGKKARHSDRNGDSWAWNDRVARNVTPSLVASSTRHALNTPMTLTSLQVKAPVSLDLSRSDTGRTCSRLEYRKDLDPTYDPIRDPKHPCHQDCDIPIPSIEPSGRQHRATKRGIRRH
jgi:hypothetical protein